MPAPDPEDETAEPQTLDQIIDWYRDTADALAARRAAVLEAVRSGTAVPERYATLTEDELAARYAGQVLELDRLTVLNLVACAEAGVRLDFRRRVKGRLKDPLSKAYRKWAKALPKKKRKRPDFEGEDGLLQQLKAADALGPGGKQLVGRFRECLPPRHWVAHGRYWARPVGLNAFNPEDVYARATALLTALL